MSSTIAADSVSIPRRSKRGILVTLWLVTLIGLLFVVFAALPYYRLSPAQFGPVWPRRWWLLLHITTGIVALFSGPVQLWLGLTDQRPHLHRRLGVIYLTAVGTSSFAAYYLATHTDFGIVFGAGLSGLATAWVVTTGLAYLAIRRHLLDLHKEWMIRSYVVTTGFISFRLLVVLLGAGGIGTIQERIGIAAWFCWSIPLLVTEAILQGRKILRVRRT
jgi:hypothetical protein